MKISLSSLNMHINGYNAVVEPRFGDKTAPLRKTKPEAKLAQLILQLARASKEDRYQSMHVEKIETRTSSDRLKKRRIGHLLLLGRRSDLRHQQSRSKHSSTHTEFEATTPVKIPRQKTPWQIGYSYTVLNHRHLPGGSHNYDVSTSVYLDDYIIRNKTTEWKIPAHALISHQSTYFSWHEVKKFVIPYIGGGHWSLEDSYYTANTYGDKQPTHPFRLPADSPRNFSLITCREKGKTPVEIKNQGLAQNVVFNLQRLLGQR